MKVQSRSVVSKLNSIFNNEFCGYWEPHWADWLPLQQDDRFKKLYDLYVGDNHPDTFDIIKFVHTKANEGMLKELDKGLCFNLLFPILSLFGAPQQGLILIQKTGVNAFKAAYSPEHHGVFEKTCSSTGVLNEITRK